MDLRAFKTAYLLPFFKNAYETRVYLGYYHFKEATFPRLESMRVRYEQKMHDRIRVRIPLQPERKFPKLSKLEKRMVTKIHRDIDVVIGSESNSALSEQRLIKSAKAIDATGSTVFDNDEEYIHVGSPDTVKDPSAPPGSYENPCLKLLCISAAVDVNGQSLNKSGVTIYVHDNTHLTGSLILKDAQKLIGSGCHLMANFDGQTQAIMTAGNHPTITQTAGSAITIANGNRIAGLHLKGGGTGNGITGTDNTGKTVLCDLKFSDTVSAIDINVASTIHSINNITSMNGGSGHGIKINGISGGVTVNSFRDIELNGHNTGLHFDRVTYLDHLGTDHNVVIKGASNTAILDNSTITGVRGLITEGSMSATGSTIGSITQNNFSAAAGTALQLVNSTVTDISSNIVSSSVNAISITGGALGSFGGSNTLTASQKGLMIKDIANLNSNIENLSITGTGVGSTGIYLDNVQLQAGRAIKSNTLSNVGEGIYLANASTVPTIETTTITGAGGVSNGININHGTVTTIGGATIASKNTISNVQKAILIPANGSAGTIQHNTLTASLIGIDQQTGGLTTIADTIISAPTGISLNNAPNLTFGTGNTITSANYGLHITATANLNSNIENLSITGTGGSATGIYLNNAALAAGRSITNNNLSGIDQGISITGSSSTVPIISRNTIQGNSGSKGIYINAQASVTTIGGSSAPEANSFTDLTHAIELAAASTAGTVRYNNINGASIDTGLLIDGSSQITTLQNNVIVATNDAIRMTGGSTITNLNQNTLTATNDAIDVASSTVTTLTSNTITSAINGITFSASTVPTIQSNVIQAGTNGLLLNSASTSNSVSSNDFTGTNKGIVVDGAGTSVAAMTNNQLQNYLKGIEKTNGGSVTLCLGNLLNLVGLGCL